MEQNMITILADGRAHNLEVTRDVLIDLEKLHGVNAYREVASMFVKTNEIKETTVAEVEQQSRDVQ
jgi:hypothetical protein